MGGFGSSWWGLGDGPAGQELPWGPRGALGATSPEVALGHRPVGRGREVSLKIGVLGATSLRDTVVARPAVEVTSKKRGSGVSPAWKGPQGHNPCGLSHGR